MAITKKGIAVAFDLPGDFLEANAQIEYDSLVLEVLEGEVSFTPCVRATVAPREITRAFSTCARFLGELCWYNQTKIDLRSCVTGGISPTNRVRRQWGREGVRISLRDFKQTVSDEAAHLGLAFYREAYATDSPFYRYISFFKVLEAALPLAEQRVAWMEAAVPKLSRSKVAIDYLRYRVQPLVLHQWLYEEGRNPLVHGGRKEGESKIDPNNFDDWQNMAWASGIVQELAENALVEVLEVKPARFIG